MANALLGTEGTVTFVPRAPHEWPLKAEAEFASYAEFQFKIAISGLPDGRTKVLFFRPLFAPVVLITCPVSFEGAGFFLVALRFSRTEFTLNFNSHIVATTDPSREAVTRVSVDLFAMSEEKKPMTFEPASAPLGGVEFGDIEPFEGCRIKILRATNHLIEYERKERAFLNKRPCEIFAKFDESGQYYNRIFRVKENIPDEFSAIIGDVVHNLRSALDLMAVELVQLAGQDAQKVHFPFCKDSTQIDEMIKKRQLDKAGSEVVDMIKKLKPYNDGNVLLRGLHDLDISDKHRVLTPVVTRMMRPKMWTDYISGFSIRLSDEDAKSKPIKNGSVIDSNIPREIEIPHDISILSICFGENQPFEGQGVVDKLKELRSLVTEIVDMFDAHVKSSR